MRSTVKRWLPGLTRNCGQQVAIGGAVAGADFVGRIPGSAGGNISAAVASIQAPYVQYNGARALVTDRTHRNMGVGALGTVTPRLLSPPHHPTVQQSPRQLRRLRALVRPRPTWRHQWIFGRRMAANISATLQNCAAGAQLPCAANELAGVGQAPGHRYCHGNDEPDFSQHHDRSSNGDARPGNAIAQQRAQAAPVAVQAN